MSRPRRALLLVGGLALLALAISSIALSPRLVRRWRIAQLASEDESARERVLRALLEEASLEALAPLLREMATDSLPTETLESGLLVFSARRTVVSSLEYLSEGLYPVASPDAAQHDGSAGDEARRGPLDVELLLSPNSRGPAHDDRPRSMRLVSWYLDRKVGSPMELLDALRPLLEDKDPRLRAHAVLAGSVLGGDAQRWAPDLLRLLARGDDELRLTAALALGEIGVPGSLLPETIEAILSLPHRVPFPTQADFPGPLLLVLSRGLDRARVVAGLIRVLRGPAPDRALRARFAAERLCKSRSLLALAVASAVESDPEDFILQDRFQLQHLVPLTPDEFGRIARTAASEGPGLVREMLFHGLLAHVDTSDMELDAETVTRLVDCFPRLSDAERLEAARILGARFWWLDTRAESTASHVRDALRTSLDSGPDPYAIKETLSVLGSHAAELYTELFAVDPGEPWALLPVLGRAEERRHLAALLSDERTSERARFRARERAQDLAVPTTIALPATREAVEAQVEILANPLAGAGILSRAARELTRLELARGERPHPETIRSLAETFTREARFGSNALPELLVSLVRLGAAETAFSLAFSMAEGRKGGESSPSRAASSAARTRDDDLDLQLVSRLLDAAGDPSAPHLERILVCLRTPLVERLELLRTDWIPLQWMLRDLNERSGEDAAHALRALGSLGASAADFAPAVAEILVTSEQESEFRDEAMAALAGIPGRPDPNVRHEAARALAGVGAGADAARTVRPLVDLLANRGDRLVGLEALRALAPSAEDVQGESLRSILAALEDLDFRVRHEATRLLGEIAPDDEPVVDALLARLGDRHASVRAAAALALGDIVRDFPGRITDTLRRALTTARETDPDERVRRECVRALAPCDGE